jgi:hypothetical protein
MMTPLFSKTSARAVAASLLCAAAMLASGCAGNQFLGTDISPVEGAGITGRAFGGNQPIIGASVQLYAAGSTGYGTGATALGSPVTTVGPGGTFTIGSYTCPTGTTQVYLLATGGNPGITAANPNSVLAAALGNCSGAAAQTVNMNEVTTAATAYALGPFIAQICSVNPTIKDCIGAPNTTQAQLGLTNAFATYNNLVTNSTGLAVTSATVTGTAGSLTLTPEASKLNTIADILATCVNTTGGTQGDTTNCGKLFAAAASAGFTLTDTFQAAVSMNQNPTSTNSTNVATLYGLAAANTAFQPTIATQPTDWTLGIKYADATTLIFPKPQNVAVDSGGNVWVLSNNSGAGGLAEISPTGTPLANPVTLNVLVGSTNTNFLFAATTTNPRNLAIDTSDNVWFTASSSATDTNGVKANGAVFEYMTGGGSTGFSTGKSAYSLAIDGAGSVYVGQQSSSAVYELYEFPAGDLTKPVTYPIATATPGTAGTSGVNTFIAPEYMAMDPSNNLWMTGGVAASTFAVELTNIPSVATILTNCSGGYPCNLSTSLSLATYNKVNLTNTSITGAWGLTADTSNMVIADALSGNSLSLVPYATPASETNVGTSTSFTLPHYVATDGGGNIWAANQNATPTGTNPTPGGSISEMNQSGTVLSPITPDITVTNPGFVHVGLGAGAGIAVDPSGNVWAAAANNSLFELVGAASPTVTPIALALKNSKVGAKP